MYLVQHGKDAVPLFFHNDSLIGRICLQEANVKPRLKATTQRVSTVVTNVQNSIF